MSEKGPLGDVFTALGGAAGFIYTGYVAAQAGVSNLGVFIAAIVGLFVGASLGRIFEHVAVRLIVLGLFILQFVAARIFWGGFWTGLTG